MHLFVRVFSNSFTSYERKLSTVLTLVVLCSAEAAATEAEFQRRYDEAWSKVYELAAKDENMQVELNKMNEPKAVKNDEIPPFDCEVRIEDKMRIYLTVYPNSKMCYKTYTHLLLTCTRRTGAT